MFTTVFTTALVTILSQLNAVHTLYRIFKTHFSALFSQPGSIKLFRHTGQHIFIFSPMPAINGAHMKFGNSQRKYKDLNKLGH